MKKRIINRFWAMVDWWDVLSLMSSWDNCQRFSPLQISSTLWAGFEHAQNLSSSFVEWSCVVVITTTPIFLKRITGEYSYFITFTFPFESFFNNKFAQFKKWQIFCRILKINFSERWNARKIVCCSSVVNFVVLSWLNVLVL